jgi:hypothetical protein
VNERGLRAGGSDGLPAHGTEAQGYLPELRGYPLSASFHPWSLTAFEALEKLNMQDPCVGLDQESFTILHEDY